MRESFMAQEDERSRQAKQAKQRQKTKSQRPKPRKLISLLLPLSVERGATCEIVVKHELPKNLGKQKVHVTLKQQVTVSGKRAEPRIERKVITIQGNGEATVQMEIPEEMMSDIVRVAAFVGEDYGSNLQHLNSKPIPVKD